MSDSADERLLRLLGGDRLAALRRRLRRHYERVSTDTADLACAPASFRLSDLSRYEYDALAALMGRPTRPSASIEVDVAAIDAALSRAGIAPSLRSALEQLDGPIVHLATARAEAVSRWVSVIERCRHPSLVRLLQAAKGMGLLKRLARQDPDAGARVCARADLVLQRLPAGGQPRAQLAAETLGDAHALDAGEPTATLVLAVLRQDGEAPDDDAPDTQVDMASDAAGGERARTVWARAGVLVNELARPALLLNLPTHGNAGAIGAPGEPAYASLRMLLRAAPRWDVNGRSILVCENPNVVAIAADRLGARCAPLVCTEGMPAAAQRTLLTQLARAGARLLYHGDFDWPGLRIASHVMGAFGARPWRFGTVDYLAAVDGSAGHAHALTGTPTEAGWDASLAPAMRARGVAVAEEAVADTLLCDLAV